MKLRLKPSSEEPECRFEVAASLVNKGVGAAVRDVDVHRVEEHPAISSPKEPLMPNVHELIRDHVTRSILCLGRLYLHAYLPKLQTSGGLMDTGHTLLVPLALSRNQ